MSPEAPGSLVVLSLEKSVDGAWSADVDRWDPAPGAGDLLRASWSAVECTGLQQTVGGGVVCATVPRGSQFQHKQQRAEQLEVDPGRLIWRDAAPGEGLMLVAVLPAGWVISTPADASSAPVDAKVFQSRFAVYWMLTGRDPVWFRVTNFSNDQEEYRLGNKVRQFRAALLDSPRAMPVFVES